MGTTVSVGVSEDTMAVSVGTMAIMEDIMVDLVDTVVSDQVIVVCLGVIYHC